MSGINALIVRAKNRQELFDKSCQVAVEHGHFSIAWIGELDPDTLDVTSVAFAGFEAKEFARAKSSARSDVPRGRGVVGHAIREKRPVFCNDIATSNYFGGPRKQEAIRRGFYSVIALPLFVDGAVVAILILYAKEPDFFNDDELKLLDELAGDISFALEHLAKNEKINYLAYYDVLTGLANRSLFLERVSQHLRSEVSGTHKLALCLIDLERFKNINDSLGRSVGDALLRQVTAWLTQNVGNVNLLARVDADHFAVVLPELNQHGDAARLIDEMMKAFLNHPFQIIDDVYRLAAKTGVALFPDDGADADTLFKNAEAALKRAKASGERYLFYAQTMSEMVASRLALENRLRQALDKDEFVLHYQPKVNFASGKITGAEALIRWNDPQTGLVLPGLFIPIMEEIGLIYEVGRWAVRKATADYLRWRSAGLPAVRVAVNVSPRQLRNRGFIADIQQAISVDSHAASGLELEITESLIMEDVKHNIASLQAIRAMGVSIAIDDFGTGFSSLSYLAKLPVDTLKIDRTFVVEMTTNSEGLTLVSTIISLAHSLKLNVVAEGVETEEQSNLLRLFKCDEMQGYFVSRPVPADIFQETFLTLPPAHT